MKVKNSIKVVIFCLSLLMGQEVIAACRKLGSRPFYKKRICLRSLHYGKGCVLSERLSKEKCIREKMLTTGMKDHKSILCQNENKLVQEQRAVDVKLAETLPIKMNFASVISELNSLQNNQQSALNGQPKHPRQLLALFEKQLHLSGIDMKEFIKLNVVHISGTKGKGSTCTFVESILRSAGLKTGCYTSPHLISVTERININGKPIDDNSFTKYFRLVFDRLKYETHSAGIPMPGYFAFLTIMAFHVFLSEKVDCVVLEVGIGGEYDPTNIVSSPIVCGITTIDYDHTNLLGTSIESIASSKAGIAKRGVPVFTIEHVQQEVLEVIRSHCEEKGSPLYVCKSMDNSPTLQLGIHGRAQLTNVALACHIADYFLKTKLNTSQSLISTRGMNVLESKLNDLPDFYANAIKHCSWPGRCQTLNYGNNIMYLDGAHTKKSMENCLDWFLEASHAHADNIKQVLLVNIIGDRSRHDILFPLALYRKFELVIFSSNRIDSSDEKPESQTFSISTDDKAMRNVYNNVNSWKCLTKELGYDDDNVIVKTNTSECMKLIDELTKLHPDYKYHILVTGSLHFVGAVLSTLSRISNKCY